MTVPPNELWLVLAQARITLAAKRAEEMGGKLRVLFAGRELIGVPADQCSFEVNKTK
jgi:hypothetical protein